MPEIDKFAKVDGRDGYRWFSIKSDIGPAMKMIKDESTRELLAFNAGTAKTNITGPLLDQLIQKRHEEALALGYSSYSEMSLQKRMAKSPLMV